MLPSMWLKASRNGDLDYQWLILLELKKKKEDKGSKKSKVDPKNICNYYKKT